MARNPRTQRQQRQSEDDVLKSAMERIQGDQREHEEDDEGGEQTTQQKPTQATGPKVAASTAKVKKSAKSAMVAYHPGPDDKSWTIFYGMKFDANVPREVTNEDLIRSARTNPWWSVDGKRAPMQRKPGPREENPEAARSGLPGGLDPAKHEVEMEDALAHES